MALLVVLSGLFPAAAAADPPAPGLTWPLLAPDAWDADVDAAEAWDMSTGDNVTVGVIDQRIDASHPKFAGRIDDGVNFVEPSAECSAGPPTLRADHGTLVAGLIVAQPDGITTIAGLAPGARVRPIRAVNDCGRASVAAVLKGIRYAADADLPIAVMSLSTDPLLPAPEKAKLATDLADAFAYASDTLFVVAAGNDGNDNDAPDRQVYPCSSEAANVVCVGMTGEATEDVPSPYTDKPVCWGNVGASSVDLFAPGVGITSTARGLTGGPAYSPTEGTSMAAPLVAAAAALIEATDPLTYGPEQLKTALTDGVDAHFELQAFATSSGRLNAARSLQGSGRFGRSGAAEPWQSCDQDHDGWRDAVDNCPGEPNFDQADDDGDDVGNACDPTRRGPDPDGDGMGAMDDACPDQHGLTGDGCPPPPPTPTPTVIVTPTPTPGSPQQPRPTPTPSPTVTPNAAPEIRVLKVDVTRSRGAKVTIRLSRTAKVSLKIERKKGRKWTRVTTKSVTASMSSKSLTLRPRGKQKKLVRGSYRLTATVAGSSKVASFKVK